jgi:hypothetical protein
MLLVASAPEGSMEVWLETLGARGVIRGVTANYAITTLPLIYNLPDRD